MDRIQGLTNVIKQQLFKSNQKNEYLVQISIIEVRELKGKDSSGTSDPFIRLTVGNKPSQVTSTKKSSTTATFSQSFTFDGLQLSDKELEYYEILIEAMDFNEFFQNQLIGSYSIGLGTLYRNKNHEFFLKWLPLIHPDHGLQPQGFLLASCYIVRSGDKPPVHDLNDMNYDDGCGLNEFADIPEDQLTNLQRIKIKELKSKLDVISIPKFMSKGYQLLVSVVKAEDIHIMSGDKVNSFVSVRAGGNVLRTNIVEDSQKPSYQTRIFLPIYFPIYNDKITVRLWDHRSMRSDIFIASIPEVSTENDYFNLNYLLNKGGIMKYRWFNLYGIPIEERPSGWDNWKGKKKVQEGTEYMGRILMSISLSPSQKPVLEERQLGAYREPKNEKYCIRIDVFEVSGTKFFGDGIIVEINIGKQKFESKPCKIKKVFAKKDKKKKDQQDEEEKKEKSFSYVWTLRDAIIPDKIFDLTKEPKHQPDILVNIKPIQYKMVGSEEKKEIQDRAAYFRLKSTSPDLQTPDAKWYKLKGCRAGDQVSSYILINLNMATEQFMKQNTRMPLKSRNMLQYVFRAHIFAGYDIMVDRVDANQKVCIPQISLANKTLQLNNIQPGKNPIWNELLEVQIEMEEKLQFASNIIIQFYSEDVEEKKENIIDLEDKDDESGEENQEEEQLDIAKQEAETIVSGQKTDEKQTLVASQSQQIDNIDSVIKHTKKKKKKKKKQQKKEGFLDKIIGIFSKKEDDKQKKDEQQQEKDKKKKKGGFFGIFDNDDDELGECHIKADTCKTDMVYNLETLKKFKCNYQFYHIIKNGISQGRILAAFHLFELEKDDKEFKQNLEKFQPILSNDEDKAPDQKKQFVEAQIQFPVIGVRDLPFNIKFPELIIRIPQVNKPAFVRRIKVFTEDDKMEKLKNKKLNYKGSINHNFARMISNICKNKKKCQKLVFPLSPKFLPQMEIELREEGGTMIFTANISLIEYVNWVENEKQVGASIFFEKGKYSFMDLQNLEEYKDDESEDEEQEDNENEDMDKEIEENQVEEEKKDDEQPKDIIFNKKFEEELAEDEEKDLEDNKFKNPNPVDKDQIDLTKDNVKQLPNQQGIQNENKSKISSKTKKSQREDIVMQPIVLTNAEFEQLLKLLKTREDKLNEDLNRKDKIKSLMSSLKILDQNKDNVQNYEQEKRNIWKEIEYIKKQEVKEKAFMTDASDQQEGGFDYPREIDKKPKDILGELPYQKYPLYLITKSQSKQNGLMALLIKSSQVILKAHFKVIGPEYESICDSSQYSWSVASVQPLKFGNKEEFNNTKKVTFNTKIQQPSQQILAKGDENKIVKQQNGLIKYRPDDDDELFFFDIFRMDQLFLQFFKNPQELKCRFYLLRCSDLSAQSSKTDYLQAMAGLDAMSSASAYPIIKVGDGIGTKDIIKFIDGKDDVVENTLEPQFFKFYELDAEIPEDWKLEVKIMNLGVTPKLIGQFIIDVEDRIFAYKHLRQVITYDYFIQDLEDKLESIRYKNDPQSKTNKNQYQTDLNRLRTKKDSIQLVDLQKHIHIEYQSLVNIEKKTCQGTVEMLLEPFPPDISQELPISHFQPPLIVWSTKEMPIPKGKKCISIFIKVALDSSATGTEEEINKETDVHNGSEDGVGEFNWRFFCINYFNRMKFPLIIPCQFPRIRVQGYDFTTFGSELIGETVISLKKILKNLRNDGKYAMPATFYKLTSSNNPDQDMGEVEISMSIITKLEAEANDVGEGQDEPNKEPFLAKPTEGRGIGDFFKGTMGEGLGGRLLLYVKIFLGIFIVVVVIMILFIKPGILVN